MTSEKRIFNLDKKGLQINSILYEFPIPLEKLRSELGEARHFVNTSPDSNDIFAWDDLGIYVYSKDNQSTHCVAFVYKREFEADFFPTQPFIDELNVEGKNIGVYLDSIKDTLRPSPLTDAIKFGPHSAYFGVDDNKELLDVQFSVPVPKVKKSNDKYKPKKVQGEKLTFSDFNFKLAVMQELMYRKELLQPKFDLEEFVEFYEKREIDLDEEGYGRIPEVVSYFENFEIESRFAAEITELHQDGGDEIYLNVICFWDGEDDGFAVKSAEDAHQFPNLKKVTVFGNPSESSIAEFESKGISLH